MATSSTRVRAGAPSRAIAARSRATACVARSGARCDPDGQAAAWPDRRHLAHRQLIARRDLEAPAPQDARGDRLDLELPEAHPDARARAAAERHVLPLAHRRLGLGGEALG